MTKEVKAVDPKCSEVAEYFTEDVTVHRDYIKELAADIQETVDDWFYRNSNHIRI